MYDSEARTGAFGAGGPLLPAVESLSSMCCTNPRTTTGLPMAGATTAPQTGALASSQGFPPPAPQATWDTGGVAGAVGADLLNHAAQQLMPENTTLSTTAALPVTGTASTPETAVPVASREASPPVRGAAWDSRGVTGAIEASPAARQLVPANAVLVTAAAVPGTEGATTTETAVSGSPPGSSPPASQAMWGTVAAQPMTQQQTAPATGVSGSSQGSTCLVSQAIGSICDSEARTGASGAGSQHPAVQQTMPETEVLGTVGAVSMTQTTLQPPTNVPGLSQVSSPLASLAVGDAAGPTAAVRGECQSPAVQGLLPGNLGAVQVNSRPAAASLSETEPAGASPLETFQKRPRSPQPTCRNGGAAQPRGQDRLSEASSKKTSEKRCVSPVPTRGTRSETQTQRRERPVPAPRLQEPVPRSFAEDLLDEAGLCCQK